jgi:alpha,alpha-trehalose phosphorylase
MLSRELLRLPEDVYPDDPWRLVEVVFDERRVGWGESVFAVSNGFIGIRGMHDEGRPVHEAATLLNGFHETWSIVHAEQAYGFARTGQTIVNVPDATLMKLYVDDEPLHLPSARLLQYERSLDLRAGVLRRELVWSTPGGKHVTVRSSRLVSFEHRHLALVVHEVEVDAPAAVVVSSQVLNRQDARAVDEPRAGDRDPRRARPFPGRVLSARGHVASGGRVITGYRTTASGMSMSVGVDHVISSPDEHEVVTSWTEDLAKVVVTATATPGARLRIEKHLTYHTSRVVPAEELVDRGLRSLDRAVALGVGGLESSQRAWMDRFWARADVEVDAGPRVQQAVRWNLFQLHQASARAETAGIPAKGLTGTGYEGHYFWDADVYMTPFLTYTEPRLTRNLLRFRHAMLPKARERAAEMSEAGALFPWRTINGEEASSYYAAGTAQYHINADVAHALRRYVDVRGDRELLVEIGAEILVETARMWSGLGFLSPEDDRFHIHGVTGPDEYTTVVNDNAYTNLMARANLRAACDAVEWLAVERPAAYRRLVRDLAIRPEEPATWRRTAEAMYVPFDADRGIHPQDDSFLEREVWDFAGTPADRYPLLLHYHPLVIYRHQVIKQADVVLAMVLLADEFSLEQRSRNFAYYDPITTGDSSLSPGVQAVIAASIGDEARAVGHFERALLVDLCDAASNTADGVHVAAAGSVWMALTYGFAGLSDHGGRLRLDPALPAAWRRLAFRLRFHERVVAVEIVRDSVRLTLEEGERLVVEVRGADVPLETGRTVDVATVPRWIDTPS